MEPAARAAKRDLSWHTITRKKTPKKPTQTKSFSLLGLLRLGFSGVSQWPRLLSMDMCVRCAEFRCEEKVKKRAWWNCGGQRFRAKTSDGWS